MGDVPDKPSVVRRPLPPVIPDRVLREVERLRLLAAEGHDAARKQLLDIVVAYRLEGLDRDC